MPKRAPFASAQFREGARQRALSRGAVLAMRGAVQPRQHNLSTYGKRCNAEKTRQRVAADPEAFSLRARAMAAKVTQEGHRKAGLAVSASTHARAGKLGGLARAQQMDAPERQRLIAIREANASESYKAGRIANLARGRATRKQG